MKEREIAVVVCSHIFVISNIAPEYLTQLTVIRGSAPIYTTNYTNKSTHTLTDTTLCIWL